MNDIEKARNKRYASEYIDAEKTRIMACFESEKCPTCDGYAFRNDQRNDGFCSEKCRQDYVKKDPNNEVLLVQVEGDLAYKVHNEIASKKEQNEKQEYKKAT